jgi:molybdate transport system substrate-binding protein
VHWRGYIFVSNIFFNFKFFVEKETKKMKMKTKLLSLVLAVAMVFGMAACGGSNTSSNQSSNANNSQQQSGSTSNSSAAKPDSSASGSSSGSTTAAVPKAEGTIYVSAAASMTESLDKVIADFKAANPKVDIIATYDSSGTLKTQIQAGSPCDVFISAASKQMNQLDGSSKDVEEAGNFVMQGTRVDLLENTCALVVSPSSNKNIKDWDSFVTAITNAKGPSDLIFAMGNSDVPVGKYTSSILKNLGLDEQALVASGVITYGTNVKEVTSQITSGAADCGIIYSTDAYSAKLPVTATADSKLTDGKVIYPAAVMEKAANVEGAKAFLEYIQSDAAMKHFKDVGFSKAA